jgi:hypothetical protein
MGDRRDEPFSRFSPFLAGATEAENGTLPDFAGKSLDRVRRENGRKRWETVQKRWNGAFLDTQQTQAPKQYGT